MPEATAKPGLIFALVGAESTGKSTLAAALSERLAQDTGLSCTWVPEYLREWCDQHARTPRIDEQAAIAAVQAQRIEAAAASHALVIADTTPLMTAVYHRQVFGDRSLDEMAVQWQRRCRLSLLTALDLPWQADGLQREGPQVREPVDGTLRALLVGANLPFCIVSGSGPARLDAALDAVAKSLRELHRLQLPAAGLLTRLLAREAARESAASTWLWPCDSCDQPDCEHASFRQRAQVSLQRG
jgi:nicotinamide riboside kinase